MRKCIDQSVTSIHDNTPHLCGDKTFANVNSQFGNMLVLAATYRSHLGKLVDKTNFIRLLDRTIVFLSELSSISSTLEKDAEILKFVKRTILMEESVASSSFSSTLS